MEESFANTHTVTSIEVIHADQMTESAVQAWLQILTCDSSLDHPQLHPDFVLAVTRAGRPVEVAILREHREIIGFFPFVRTSKSWGEPFAGPTSDFEAIVLRPEVKCSIPRLLTECGLTGWTFTHLSTQQKFFNRFHAYLDEAPYMDLASGYDAYRKFLRDRSRSTISSLERKSRKMEREIGPISFEYRANDVAGALALLNDWKQRQLLKQGFNNMFQLTWVGRLLTLCSQQQTEAFSGIVSVLKAGNHPVAVHFGLLSGKVFQSWIPAYHPEYQNYSPGAQLLLRIAESAAGEGVSRLDLGRGENQLKQSLKSAACMLAIGTASTSASKAFLRNRVLKLRCQLRSNRWLYKIWRRTKATTQS